MDDEKDVRRRAFDDSVKKIVQWVREVWYNTGHGKAGDRHLFLENANGGLMNGDLHYRNIPCSRMTEKDIQDCSDVFSENYGSWSDAAAPKQVDKPIRMGPSLIRSSFVEKPDRFVALMYDGEKLIGQAFYLRRECPWQPSKKITFILQLVLARPYRGNRLGLKLLQSVFGLSDDAAWGLFTSNPLTIRALEDATFRHISVEIVERRVQDLKTVLADVFSDTHWLDTFHSGCVDTNFAVRHDDNPDKIKKAYPDGGFPFTTPLGQTEEWLAVVFHSQPIDFNAASLRIFTKTSQEVLREAYSRMDVQNQGWARHAAEEIQFLFDRGYVKPGDRVLDLGCGMGRHAFELARRGCHVDAIDFSRRMIELARRENDEGLDVTFEQADIIHYRPRGGYDVVICLYDVIGSSTDPQDNQAIVDVIGRSLKTSGHAIVSVMNLEMIQKVCRAGGNRVESMDDGDAFSKLVKLPPSTTMQDSGEIFNGQLMILDEGAGVVYRKEQFNLNDLMPVEYVIADKRYTMEELKRLFLDFKMVSLSCVRAGHWEQSLPPEECHAKEILGVFQKKKVGKDK